jgi:hypothetical protein
MPLDSTAAEHLARIQEAAGDKTGARKTIADLQSGWEALWRRFPGYAPVAITYSRTLSEQARDLDRARAVLRESAAAACRASDRTRIELALAEIGGR